MRHVVLVGATDGIGLALAHAFLERSWRVGLLGRDPDKVRDRVATLADGFPGSSVVGGVWDVTDRPAAVPALEGVLADLGQMDLLVYCAGVPGVGGRDPERRAFDVNALGAFEALAWGAAYFVQAGRGRLAAIGSVAGDRGRKGDPSYAASKAALHTWLQSMRHRLHGSGVGVTTIKPGWVRTRMLGDVPGFPPSISPARAAAVIVRALDAGRDTVYVPWWWEAVALALRLTPEPIFKRLAPP